MIYDNEEIQVFLPYNLQSVHVFARRDIDMLANKILESQLTHLEDVCTEVKEILLVRSYHDLLSRYSISVSVYIVLIIHIYL